MKDMASETRSLEWHAPGSLPQLTRHCLVPAATLSGPSVPDATLWHPQHLEAALLFLLLACAPDITVGPAGRATPVISPRDWDGEEALPVVFLLHGLGANAGRQDWYMGFSDRVDDYRFHLLLPEGLARAQDGKQSWDAGDHCCNLLDEVDDVGFLLGLHDELVADFGAEERAVYFGHSNGHFMSYRMACEAPERIRAIGGLAGSVPWDPAACASGAPVNSLHLHGTNDRAVPYDGAVGEHPSAPDAVARWAERAGCTGSRSGAARNLTRGSGQETRTERHTGCSHRVELWTMDNTAHSPWLHGPRFSDAVLGWLLEGVE